MRVKGGITKRARHNKVMKRAKGFCNARSRIFTRANTAIMKAGQYAYRDRRARKREMRALWIARINAAAREVGVKYSELIHWMDQANITMDRRVLADMALHQPEDFKSLVEQARSLAQQ